MVYLLDCIYEFLKFMKLMRKVSYVSGVELRGFFCVYFFSKFVRVVNVEYVSIIVLVIINYLYSDSEVIFLIS